MKNINLTLFGTTLFVVLSLSCTRESSGDGGKGGDDRELVHIVFNTFSGGGETKTTIDSVFIKWLAGDSISVFDGGESDNHIFRLTAGAGSNSATFEGYAAASGPYWALYPYTSGASVNTSGNFISNVTVPDTQTVVSGGSVDPAATVMVSKTVSKDSLKFSNVLSYIKVTPASNCLKIVVASKGSENLVGKGTVTITDTIPAFSVTSEGSPSVVLTGMMEAETAYYIAVLPVNLASGLRMDFYFKDGNITRSETAGAFRLRGGRVYNGGIGDGKQLFAGGDVQYIIQDVTDW